MQTAQSGIRAAQRGQQELLSWVKMDMEDAVKKDPVDSKTVAQMLVDVDMEKKNLDWANIVPKHF